MKKKKLLILVIQTVLIVMSVFLLLAYTNNQIKATDVYVYNGDISDVTVPVTAEDVKKVSIPAKAITKDFALKVDDIVGKHVDSKVKAGQYVYKSQLIDYENVDVFEVIDLSKYRKISLPITLVDGFSGNMRRGDKVDLVYTGEGTKTNEETKKEEVFKYSKVFLQDIIVYSVNTSDGYKYVDVSSMSQSENLSGDKISSDKKQKIETITLVVTLEQAEEIEARNNAGAIRFLGRFDDSKSYDTLGYVLGDYQKVFSGKGFAETGNVFIEEDKYDYIEEIEDEGKDEVEKGQEDEFEVIDKELKKND